MKSYQVIGYAFEGSIHCPGCTFKRFPGGEGEDSEGNEVGAVFAGESDGTEYCNDCLEPLT